MIPRTYLLLSGTLFALITIGQLARLTLQVPIQIGDMMIPIWPSYIAAALALTLCVWAFRLATR